MHIRVLSIIAHAEYLALGLSGVLMTSLEWWSFELLGLGAGYLGVVSLATHNIMANVVVLAFMLSLGVSIGVRPPLPPSPPPPSFFFLLSSCSCASSFSFIMLGVLVGEITYHFSGVFVLCSDFGSHWSTIRGGSPESREVTFNGRYRTWCDVQRNRGAHRAARTQCHWPYIHERSTSDQECFCTRAVGICFYIMRWCTGRCAGDNERNCDAELGRDVRDRCKLFHCFATGFFSCIRPSCQARPFWIVVRYDYGGYLLF